MTVKIESWESGSIDTAGCSNRKGHCIQSKSSPRDIGSIMRQKGDFDIIFTRTGGKAKGAFVTYSEKGNFEQFLNVNGIDPNECTVYGRTDLVNLEDRLLE